LQQARRVPEAVAQVPRVQRVMARTEAIIAVMGLVAQPQARTAAEAKLAAWQVQEEQQVAGAHRVVQVRSAAQLALWRARADLWAGQPAQAAVAAQAGLSGIDDEVLARVGAIEQGQLQALWAEALLTAADDTDSACRLAALATASLAISVPMAPEARLAGRLDARCRGQALPTASVTDNRLLMGSAWQQRDQAIARSFGR
jgi:hypothetical protein